MPFTKPLGFRAALPGWPGGGLPGTLAIGGAMLAGLDTAHAADPQLLPDTVVTASRLPEESQDTMSTVTAVTADEFFQQGHRTIPESLANTPGVMVQKTTHGHGSPFIRGFTGRQNLLLVDGVRINNSTYRSGPIQYWNTVDGDAMDRLELVKSQGSVLFGSDALGGTLNVISRGSGFLTEDPGWFFGGAATYRFESNSESHLGRLEARFGEGGAWGALLGVVAKDFGDLRDSALGRFHSTGYPEQNLDLKIEGLLNPQTTLTFAHQNLNQDEVWRWHSTLFNDTPWNGTSTGTFPARIYDQERSLTYLRLHGEPAAGLVQDYSATVSYQKSQDSEFQNRSPADMRNQVIDVESYGIDLQAESALGGGSLLYGLDYYRDGIDSAGTRTGRDPRSARPVADDSTYHLFGAFGHYRRPVTDTLELSAGGRFTHAEADLGKVWNGSEDISSSASWSNVVFNFRGRYQLNQWWDIYGGASQGFRAPNANDLSGNITSRSGDEETGSLDLDPEDSWTFELGTRVTNECFDFRAAAFYTLVDDLITRIPESSMAGSPVITTNGQEAEIYGVEFEAVWRFHDNWTLSGFLTWQDGEVERPASLEPGAPVITEPVSRLSPLRGSVALRFDTPDGRWWTEGRVTAAGQQDDLSASDQRDTQRIPPGGTPGYVVGSLHAGVQATEDLELSLTLENLTDEDYRVHGSGVNGSGFNAILAARLTF